MNLFSGLEKFGLKPEDSKEILESAKKEEIHKEEQKKETVKKEIPPEKDFLLPKTIHCKVCDKDFKTKAVKSGKARRLQPDRDLRPRFQYIDTLKYDVISCPHCGYSALSRDFDRIVPARAKMIREQISEKFTPMEEPEQDFYTYDMAIARYKLALLNTAVKKGKESEKAYTCLKLAWILRGKADTLSEDIPEEKEAKKECQEEEEVFYQQAYEGFSKAISEEMYPICGMDENTMDYLLAYMSYHFEKYEMASKCLARVLTSSNASRRLKDMALELKEDIVAKLKH